MKFQNGFSLAEVMVASGLMGVVLLFAVKFFSNVEKSNSKVAEDIETTLGRLQMSKSINYDIGNSRYSFNAIDIEDDNGQGFFDYYFDSPCEKECSRTFTLDIPKIDGEVSQSLYFITSDKTYGKDIMFSPLQAYSDSSLKFISLNNKGYLEKRAFTPWIKGKLLFIYNTSAVREDGANPQVVAPRHMSYLGWVHNISKSGKLRRETIEDGNRTLFHRFDPRDGEEIDSEDEALRRVPYIHGLGNDVFITTVNLVRYRLKAEQQGRGLSIKLYRGVKKLDSEYRETVVGEGVKSLQFVRDNVSRGEIKVILEVDEK